MMVDRILKFGVVAVATLAGALGNVGLAFADGMPAPRAYQEYRPCANWAGVYVGPHVGGGFAHTKWTWVNDNFFDLAPGDHSQVDPFGYVFGFHGGVQHQMGCWVAGVEGTFSGGDVTKKIISPFFPDFDHHTASITSIATVTGRLGYSIRDVLLYGKAGYATGRVDLRAVTDKEAIGAGSNDWQRGWVVGGGFDYQIGKYILLGLEYNYINLGDRTRTFSCTDTPDCGGFPNPIVKTDVDMHVVTARLTFLFGREERAEPIK